jgi:SAM-dependent methyltransferase
MHIFWALSAESQFEPPATSGEYVRLLSQHVRSADPILDVGCNRGWACQLFENYTGIDTNADAISQARDHWVDKRSHARFVHLVDERSDLPFEAERFGLVFAKDVLEHTVDPVRFLQQIARVLQPSGVLFLCTPDAQTWVWNDPTHVRPYPRAAHRALAEMAGFQFVDSGYESVAPGTQVFARMLGARRMPFPYRIAAWLPMWPRNVWSILRKTHVGKT